MRLIPTTHITAAVLAAALALPVAAWAQTSTTTTQPPAMQTQPAGTPQQRVEQHIADMYATLRITQAQEKQWNEFAQVMLDNAQAIDMLISKNRADMATENAVQALRNYGAIAQQHAQNVQKLLPAFTSLYAALTSEQKKQADELFRQRAEEREQKQGAAQGAPMATQKQGG